MKAFRYIILTVVSLVMFSCGENLEAYKEKVLDAVASKLETTKELFVKDFDVVIDSMSVHPLTVGDSLALLATDFNRDKSKIDKKLVELKEELEKHQKKSWDYLVEFTQERIKQKENELTSLTEKYNKKVEYYSKMDKNKVLAKAFCCRFSTKQMLTGVHKTLRGAFLFSPDGERYLSDTTNSVFNLFREKTEK